MLERGDAALLAERLQALLADPARCRATGQQGWRLVEQRYDVRQTLHSYQELCVSATSSSHDPS